MADTRPPRTRTYQVIDGDGQQDYVPDLRRRKSTRNAILLGVATTLVTGAVGIATSRWGGVSKAAFEDALLTQKRELNERIDAVSSKVGAVGAEVHAVAGTVGGIQTLLKQQVDARKPRSRRAPQVETP